MTRFDSKTRGGLRHVGWPLVLVSLAFAALIATMWSSPFLPSALRGAYVAGTLVFTVCAAVMWVWRSPDTPPWGPVQILLVSLAIKLVVTPVLHAQFGLQLRNLPSSPSTDGMVLAQHLYIAAALASTAGYLSFYRPSRRNVTWNLPQRGVVPLVILGVLGAGISLAAAISRVELPSAALPITLIKALTPVAAILLAFTWPKRRSVNPLSAWGAALATIFIIILLAGTSRASVIYPCLALLATFTLLNRRINVLHITGLGVMVLAAWLSAGQVRERMLLGNQTYYSTDRQFRGAEVASTLSNYFSGAPYGGFALDTTPTHQRTLLPSLLESVPRIGVAFRDRSGSALYNKAIYANRGIRDQLYPASVEIYRNVGGAGLAVIYIALGILVGWFQMVFRSSAPDNLVRAYLAAYLTILACASVNLSVSVLGQFAVYNAAPLLLFWLWARRYASAAPPQEAQAY